MVLSAWIDLWGDVLRKRGPNGDVTLGGVVNSLIMGWGGFKTKS